MNACVCALFIEENVFQFESWKIGYLILIIFLFI